MLKGIDISHHQNGINIAKTDVDFVICKATEGVGYVDNCCDKFYQEAKRLGKKLGVYHFARPDLGNSAEAEANFFIENIKGYIKEAMLVLDWERGNLNNPSWVRSFCDIVFSKTGVKPVVYMSRSPENSYDWSSIVEGDYGLWIADYTGKQPTSKNWNLYCMWQYTSRGRVDGYNGNVDMNYFYGDNVAWDKYACGSANNNTPIKQKTTVNVPDQILEIGSKVKFDGVFRVDEIIKPNSKYPDGAVGCYSTCFGAPIGKNDWIPSTHLATVDKKGNNVNYNGVMKKGGYWASAYVFNVVAVEKPSKKYPCGIAIVESDGIKFRCDCRPLWEMSNN